MKPRDWGVTILASKTESELALLFCNMINAATLVVNDVL